MAFIFSCCGLRRKRVKDGRYVSGKDIFSTLPIVDLCIAKAESGNVAFGRHDNNHYSYNISAPPPPNNAFIPFPTAPNGTRFSHELAAPTPWLDPNNNAQQIQGWQPSIPAPVFQSQEQVERQCQRDWEEWVRKESRTLPQRQAEFDRRKDVFVQITRENSKFFQLQMWYMAYSRRALAFNFYGLDSRTLNATVPRRIFQHNAGGGCASEHRAVRRVAYMKTAYLAGLHQSFPEDQLYDRGRKLFNERLVA